MVAYGRSNVFSDRYIFEYEVGLWTFGTMQVLRDRTTGSLRTCKVAPKANLQPVGDVTARLRKLQDLKSKHICNIVDVLEDRDCFYIISDRPQGGDVAEWIERIEEGYHVQEHTCAAYIRHALLALSHSHAAGICHGDLSPTVLMLTSKMPDAEVTVGNCGIAEVLDPSQVAVKRSASPFLAPEVRSGNRGKVRGAQDIWSIGAIAHALLTGEPPSGKKADDDDWAERSKASRDFVRQMLAAEGERPTAARALQHPWLRSAPLRGIFSTDDSVTKAIRDKTLCYTLALLLTPVMAPQRDFEQLRLAFEEADTDHDGMVPRPVAQRLLRRRCALNEAVNAAMDITDPGTTEVFDLCAAASADIIAREFFASGPTAQPLVCPLQASDLLPRMVKRFFEVYGERNSQPPTVTRTTLGMKLRTATAREVEEYCGVRYAVIIGALPSEYDPVDADSLMKLLSANACAGTPLGPDLAVSVSGADEPWGSAVCAVDGLEDFVTSIFNSCGIGNTKQSRGGRYRSGGS